MILKMLAAQKYVDPKRKQSGGNQSEIPILKKNKDYYEFGGYQKFNLYQSKIVNKSEIDKKINLVLPVLVNHYKDSTIIDIGCSNGGIGFNLYHAGYQNITCADHDKEYIANVDQGIKFLSANTMKTLRADITNINESYDIVMMYAVIHWIYSCTAGFGSLDKIIQFLAGKCNQTMFIEWVDPKDQAICGFKHQQYNKDVHEEPYTKKNFIKALHTYFPYVKHLGNIRSTREIWVASKAMLNFEVTAEYEKVNSYTSTVYIDPTKTFAIKKNKFNIHSCFDREIYWLQQLADLPFTPNLLYFDKEKLYMVMDYCGDRVNKENEPKDFKEQCKNILAQLKDNNCYPLDIKLTKEVLIKNDKVYICDFGWCPTIDKDYTIGGRFDNIPGSLLKKIDVKNQLISAMR